MGEAKNCPRASDDMSFESFARDHGLILDYAVADGRWHRCPTEDKPRKRNGAYLFEGERGVVKNFATMVDFAAYRDGNRPVFVNKTQLRDQRRHSERELIARQSEAREKAKDMVKRAAFDIHPYLATKGFPKERGLVLEGELLVPMREFSNYGQLNSLQRISADGTKMFLPGGKAKSSVLKIGPRFAVETWLSEGLATGLSVRLALRSLHRDAQVMCCFSAGNLAHVGRLARNWRSKVCVCADHDVSGAGQRAAEETGLPWIMPTEEGDANDLMQSSGVWAVAKLIRTVRARAENSA